jgi:mRNA interferase HigB
VRIISVKRLREFWTQHPEAETPLRAWYRVAKHSSWPSFADVRGTYRSADWVGSRVVFDVGGNKFRLVVAIRFDRGIVYIRHVLTHAEYDRGRWKDEP